MPQLSRPILPTGSLGATPQPDLVIDDQLTLRPWRADDVAVVRAAFDDPDIRRWHVRRLDSADEAHAWIADWAQRWAAETDASWAIADRGGRPVGQAGLRTVELSDASAQLSYWVLPGARGKGVAVRTVAALSRWCFDTIGLNRLCLMHSTANEASCRVAEKAGFAIEGTLRESMLHEDGLHDAHLHARLRGTAC